jgi:hypothetical protein
VNGLVSPGAAPAELRLVPERIYPTQAKPVPKKKRFKLRDLEPLIRRRIGERREVGLGAAGRIQARFDGEDVQSCTGERVAVYSHFSSTGRVSAMVQSQLEIYAAQGFEVIFVSMCASLRDEDIDRLRRLCRAVIVRRSFGRDFGAWRDVMRSDFVKIDRVRELLLVNDSVLGPIRPIEPLFEQMRSSEGVWGLINSDQNGSHLQTFFLLSRGREAVEAVFAFLEDIALSADKEIMIKNGELSFSTFIARRNVPVWSLYGLRQIEDAALKDKRKRLQTVLSLGHQGIYEYTNNNPEASDEDLNVRIRNVFISSPVNPTHQFGEILVREFDFPFIKTELLVVNPTNMPIASNWRSLIIDESRCSIDMIVEHLCLL